jgi:outer membrane protein
VTGLRRLPSIGAARHALCLIVAATLLAAQLPAQDLPPTVSRPQVMIPIRDYMAPTIAPIRLTNSQRLYTLMRAGNLYLSAEDALALAIENNLNLEINRYGPQLADAALERAKAGGPIRGVPSGTSQISTVNSGVGVNGAAAAAGVGGGGGGTGGGGGGNSTIQQVGAITPNLDPVLQSAVSVSHLTYPQANTVLSHINAVVDSTHASNTTLQQGTLTGGTATFRGYDQYLNENSPSNFLNPTSAPRMEVTLRQNLLQGFGVKLNNRGIRIADVNRVASRESFRSQLLDLVVTVLNLYWDYVGARDQLKLREHALALTEKFRDDTKYEISVGALAGVELPRAQADVARRRQDVVIAQAAVRQRAILLKEALSHTEDPALETAEIIPTDRLPQPPEDETLPPLRDMVKRAMAKRPDVAVAKYRDQTDEMNLIGTTNPLLPSLQLTFDTYNRGVAGTPQASGGTGNNFFAGGYGTAMGQVLRRNFPNEIGTLSFSIPFNNRPAQADYGIDQLQYRQSQLGRQRDQNQIVVDISSQMAAVTQARSRYATARNTRILQEQLLAAEQKKSYGAATYNVVMTDQRALIDAQLSEMAAVAAYNRAKISLDQVLGETLDRNSITLEEGLAGRLTKESRLPDVVEGSKN